jgi:hypothetical protein
MGEWQTIQWPTDTRTIGQTMTYILHINLSGKDTYHAYVISDNCCRPYRYRHVETPYRIIVFISIYRITLILSLCINWYLYSTINKLYLLVYPGNQMKYLKVYNLQTCNLLIYTNATAMYISLRTSRKYVRTSEMW